MIIVIRIGGLVDVPRHVNETLFRMRLRRKYSAVILKDNAINRKLLQRVRSYVAYGKANEKLLIQLIAARGERIDHKKIDAEEVVSLLSKKNLSEQGLKPFFRLHPPRKGIESKKYAGHGKGVLGDHDDSINLLLERML